MLTHDVGTMAAAAWARVRNGLPMSGAIELDSDQATGALIADLGLIALAPLGGPVGP